MGSSSIPTSRHHRQLRGTREHRRRASRAPRRCRHEDVREHRRRVRMGLTSIVKVTLGDAAIHKNNVGVVVQQSSPATPTTFATIRTNLTYENTGPGVILSCGTLSPMRGLAVSCLWTGVACAPAWSLAGACGSTGNSDLLVRGRHDPGHARSVCKERERRRGRPRAMAVRHDEPKVGQDSTSFVRSDLNLHVMASFTARRRFGGRGTASPRRRSPRRSA